jgi:hypothetical protein
MRVWSRLTYLLIAICPYVSRVCVGVYFFRFYAVKTGAETNVSRPEGVGERVNWGVIL